MADPKPLNLIDMETISEAILQMVAQYPDLPFTATAKNIVWQNTPPDGGMGIIPLPNGAFYVSQYLSGSYVAQVPFRIIYRANPTTNPGRIEKENLVHDLSEWLETCTATFTDARIQLQKIERTSPVYKSQAQDSGYEDYTCTLTLEYFYKKGR